jgi:hypothetical protein
MRRTLLFLPTPQVAEAAAQAVSVVLVVLVEMAGGPLDQTGVPEHQGTPVYQVPKERGNLKHPQVKTIKS